MELLMGILLLASMSGMTGRMEAVPSNSISETLCVDLASLHTYGRNIGEWVERYYPEWNIEWQSTPFENEKEKGIVCHAERIENGMNVPLFIRIR
jgi:hypothetical protein